ncbi:conserved hypothetical protein [Neospora caninum Liverpool]|uniref:Uncharacterized protein n=1 Tax=Neospora caninum (strain Liverpool) TaxID=572307 RepID=F0VN27_NEOCL|nr:conserved hypothetical protein [Neospora caninum Liverpool]CBZ55123.1 conserved hypothetical protein [Neospora caninum Liverpool]|eukprot:XP_003885151.1 conserved hypothetical protein [Neospora caninum Liverpool]
MAPRSIFIAVLATSGLSCCLPLQTAAADDMEKSLQRPEMLPFLPFLWKNEGLLFTDVLLQKLLLPFGLTSPYTNFFLTEAIRDIVNDLDFSDVEGRRLRGRQLQSSESPKEAIRSFARSLHGALGGNVFDLTFADQLIDQLPSSFSEQLASVTEAFGGEILRVLADAENPASVIIQQLVAPFEGDGMPFLMGSEPMQAAGDSPRTLQEVKTIDGAPTAEVNRADDASVEMLKMIEAALGEFGTSSADNSVESEQSASSVEENLAARVDVVNVAHEIGQKFGVAELYANLAGAFCDEFLIPAGLVKKVAALILEAKAALGEEDLNQWNPLSLLVGMIGSKNGDQAELHELLALAEKLAVKALLLAKSSAKAFTTALLVPKALSALALKSSDLLKLPTLMGKGFDGFDLLKIPLLLGGVKLLYPEACLKILGHALQIGNRVGKGLLYLAVSKAVVHTILDPLGLTEIVADLIAAKFEKAGGDAGPFSGPARTVTIVEALPSAEVQNMDTKEKILDLARQAGEVTGNEELYATLMGFFVDSVLEPLELTDAVAESLSDTAATISTAAGDVSITNVIEDLVAAVYTS